MRSAKSPLSEPGDGAARDRSTLGKIMNVWRQLAFVNWTFHLGVRDRGVFSL